MSEAEHKPERRVADANYHDLSRRVTLLEGSMTENTRLTTDMHEKNSEMYEAFVTARNGVRLVTAIGNGAMVTADWAARRAKTFLVLAFTFGAIWTFFRTGKIPDWFQTVIKAITG